MTEEDFIFDGETLSDYGYIIVSDDMLDLDTAVSSMNYNTIQAARSDVSHKVGTSYEEKYTVDIEIMKHPCSDNNLDLTNNDISTISKWLCRKEYKLFRWIDDIGQDEIWFEAKISIDKKVYGDSVIGLVLHVETNRPYGLTREFTNVWQNAQGNHVIYVNSDEEGYINPDMKITVNSDCDIEVYNYFEDRSMVINNCVAGEIITIKGGDTLQISSSITEHDLSSDFNYKFFRLCNLYHNNKNNIRVTGNCNIEIKYRGIRKVGM